MSEENGLKSVDKEEAFKIIKSLLREALSIPYDNEHTITGLVAMVKQRLDSNASEFSVKVDVDTSDIEALGERMVQAVREEMAKAMEQLKLPAITINAAGPFSIDAPAGSGGVNVAGEVGDDAPAEDADGCPTEKAVLKRFWRAHNSRKESDLPWALKDRFFITEERNMFYVVRKTEDGGNIYIYSSATKDHCLLMLNEIHKAMGYAYVF